MEISPFKKARTEFEAAEKKLQANNGKLKTEGYFEQQEALDKLIRLTPENYKDAAEWLIAMATIARMREDIRWFPKQLETMLEQLVISVESVVNTNVAAPVQISEQAQQDHTVQAIQDLHSKLQADYRDLLKQGVETEAEIAGNIERTTLG